MDNTLRRNEDERILPDVVECYFIKEDGDVTTCNAMAADVYISEFDVTWLSDKETMLYIRNTYGPKIGVMHDVACEIQPRVYRTPKVLLGVFKSQQE